MQSKNHRLLAAWISKRAEFLEKDGSIKHVGHGGRGVTVRTLAAELGVTTAAVYFWINGVQPPSRANARKLEKITGGAVPRGDW